MLKRKVLNRKLNINSVSIIIYGWNSTNEIIQNILNSNVRQYIYIYN